MAASPIACFDAGRQAGRGGLLDQLLMSALRRAVARADPHDVAVLVADDLHFDVARPREVALDVDLVAAEERLRLALGAVHRLLHVVGAEHHLHAAAAASVRGLDHQRVAELGAELEDLVDADVANSVVPGTIGAPPRCAALPRADLVAHLVDGLRRRADERHTLGVMARAKSAFSLKNP